MAVLLVVVVSRRVGEALPLTYATPPFCEQKKKRKKKKREREQKRGTEAQERKRKDKENIRMFLLVCCGW